MLDRRLLGTLILGAIACAQPSSEPEMIRVGCGSGKLVACDNQPGPERDACNPDSDHEPQTIALFDGVDGLLVSRLRDPGRGVGVEILEESGDWMKIRTCDARDEVVGWVSWKEGFSLQSRIRFR